MISAKFAPKKILQESVVWFGDVIIKQYRINGLIKHSAKAKIHSLNKYWAKSDFSISGLKKKQIGLKQIGL